MTKQEITQLIYEAVDEVNETLDSPIEKAETTVLFGGGKTHYSTLWSL